MSKEISEDQLTTFPFDFECDRSESDFDIPQATVPLEIVSRRSLCCSLFGLSSLLLVETVANLRMAKKSPHDIDFTLKRSFGKQNFR